MGCQFSTVCNPCALVFIEPEAIESMFNSILGWAFLFVILVLELIGGLFIRKIVRIDV